MPTTQIWTLVYAPKLSSDRTQILTSILYQAPRLYQAPGLYQPRAFIDWSPTSYDPYQMAFVRWCLLSLVLLDNSLWFTQKNKKKNASLQSFQFMSNLYTVLGLRSLSGPDSSPCQSSLIPSHNTHTNWHVKIGWNISICQSPNPIQCNILLYFYTNKRKFKHNLCTFYY